MDVFRVSFCWLASYMPDQVGLHAQDCANANILLLGVYIDIAFAPGCDVFEF